MSTNSSRYMVALMTTVPLVMLWTKSQRIDGREEFDVMMQIRYRAVFWERANDFTAALRGHVLASILEDRPNADEEGDVAKASV